MLNLMNRAFRSYYQSKDSDYFSIINAILYLIYLWDSILIDDVSKFSLTSDHVNLFFTPCEKCGKRMAFTSPTSGYGLIFPVSELVKQGFVPKGDRW